MDEFVADVRALVSALPARLAAVQSLLTAVAIYVVPLLPDNVAVQVAAVLVVLAGWVAAATRVVGHVTRVPAGAEGLTLPPNRELRLELVNAAGRTVSERRVRPEDVTPSR